MRPPTCYAPLGSHLLLFCSLFFVCPVSTVLLPRTSRVPAARPLFLVTRAACRVLQGRQDARCPDKQEVSQRCLATYFFNNQLDL
ncbi:hypothetical protein T492DRAFT_925480, partial [Pavlovales sp. CCMP2436]